VTQFKEEQINKGRFVYCSLSLRTVCEVPPHAGNRSGKPAESCNGRRLCLEGFGMNRKRSVENWGEKRYFPNNPNHPRLYRSRIARNGLGCGVFHL